MLDEPKIEPEKYFAGGGYAARCPTNYMQRKSQPEPFPVDKAGRNSRHPTLTQEVRRFPLILNNCFMIATYIRRENTYIVHLEKNLKARSSEPS